jgi:S1-C subfamily serine protease
MAGLARWTITKADDVVKKCNGNPVEGVSNRVKVKRVSPGTCGEKAGLKPGDIIPSTNRMEVKSIGQITRSLQAYKVGKRVWLKILRGNKTKEICPENVYIKERDRG